ncbi:MAG: DUF4402 domain-containing protein [Novosphingobium sp.]
MQRLLRSFCALPVLALASLFAVPAHAERVNATGASQATVVAPLSLIKIRDLKFGRIAARTVAGTVTVNPNTGACTVTGPILSVGGCGFSEFAGMGTRRMNVRIQIPTTVTLTGPGGATMLADTFTLATSPDLSYIGGNGNGIGNGNRRYSINSNTGIFTFRIGGRLNVRANQAPGVYNGTFSVTVVYQ